METTPEGPFQIQLRGTWQSVDELPVHLANQIAVQELQGTIFLTFGQAAPGIIDGTIAEQVKKAQEEGLKIEPLVRLAIPLENFRNLVTNLQGLVERLDKGKEVQG